MKRRIVFSVLMIPLLLTGQVQSQGTIYVNPYYKANYIFQEGFWVYRDTLTGETDSCSLESVHHGFYSPNPVFTDYREFYKVWYFSHSTGTTYNDHFMDYLWRINGGGEWGELGQPVMMVNYYGPMMGGYNGYEILAILDSIVLQNYVFYNAAWSHIEEEEQYQPEFEFDTDLYYVPGVGLARKEYTDDNLVHHVWELMNYENSPLTGTSEVSTMPDEIIIYPNPCHDMIFITGRDSYHCNIFDLSGKLLYQGEGIKWNVRFLPPGIYLMLLINERSNLTKTEKLIRY